MTSPITALPPRVTYRGAGGQVYLLAWIRTPQGMRARVTWCEVYEGSTDYRWQVAEVEATAVAKVEGQSYAAVPVEERGETTIPSQQQPRSWRRKGS